MTKTTLFILTMVFCVLALFISLCVIWHNMTEALNMMDTEKELILDCTILEKEGDNVIVSCKFN